VSTLIPDRDQIRAYFCALVRSGDVHEIRVPNPRDRRLGVISGYVDNEEDFVRLASSIDGTGAESVYATLNPVTPAILARAANRLQRNAKTLTGDGDVLCYRNLLVDVDPVRPAGISATDREREAALTIRTAVVAFLAEQGWPDPVVNGSSGNGGLLIYRLPDLRNTKESGALVKAVLESLASLFNTPAVKVDTSVANPSRLVKVVGTVAAKGDHTPDRPWRLATAAINPCAGTVSREQLATLVEAAEDAEVPEDGGGAMKHGGQDPKEEPPPDGRDHSSGQDTPAAAAALRKIEVALAAKGLGYAVKRPDGRIVLDLRQCLTSSDHASGACITIFPSGALHYRCLHDGCKDKGWSDAKVALGLSSSSSFVRGTPGKASIGPLPGVPAFPTDVLPQTVRCYVEAHAAALGVPPELVAVPLLVFAGATIGNRVRIRLKPGFEQRPILYAAVVAPPGSAKSPALDAARTPLDNLQRAALETFKEDLAAWEQAVIEAKKAKRPLPSRPELQQFFTTDATLEALAPMAAGSPGVAMVRDELVSWVKSCDAYRSGRGGDRQAWLSGWAGAPLKVDRKSADPIYVPYPVIGVTGGIQPDMLSELSDEAGRRDGFVERLLWAYPDSTASPWSEAAVPSEDQLALLDLFGRLRPPRGAPADHADTVVCLSNTARARWVAWYNENIALTAEASGLTQGIYAKLPNQLARLALILHCLAHPDNPGIALDDGTMADAIELVEYFRQHAHRVLVHFGALSPARLAGLDGRVIRILDQADGWVDRTALHRRLGGHVAAQALSAALSRLESEGLAERRSVPTEGRPAEQWRAVARGNEEDEERPEKPHEETEFRPTAGAEAATKKDAGSFAEPTGNPFDANHRRPHGGEPSDEPKGQPHGARAAGGSDHVDSARSSHSANGAGERENVAGLTHADRGEDEGNVPAGASATVRFDVVNDDPGEPGVPSVVSDKVGAGRSQERGGSDGVGTSLVDAGADAGASPVNAGEQVGEPPTTGPRAKKSRGSAPRSAHAGDSVVPDAPVANADTAVRDKILRALHEAKEALYRDDLIRLVGYDLAAIQPVVAALAQEGILASNDADEPFYLRGRWAEAG